MIATIERKLRVLYDAEGERFFKGMRSGWDDLPQADIEWVSSLRKAARYSMSENDTEVLERIVERFKAELGLELAIETYVRKEIWEQVDGT